MRTSIRSLVVAASLAAAATPFTMGRAYAWGTGAELPSGPPAMPFGGYGPYAPYAPCAGNAPTEQPTGPIAPTTPTTPTAQAPASEPGGIVQFLDQALGGISLRPEQSEALKELGHEVDAKVATVDKAKREFLDALADQMQSGHIDEKALEAAIQKVDEAVQTVSPAVHGAFQKIHDTLDADQRKEFVDHFRDELKQKEAKTGPKAKLDEMAKELALTEDQKDKIGAILEQDMKPSGEMRDRFGKLLDAFPSDKFSVDDVLPGGQAAEHVDKMLHRMVDVASQVSDILTPDQREKAAELLHQKAARKFPQGGESPEQTGTSHQGQWIGGPFYGGYGAGLPYYGGFGFGAWPAFGGFGYGGGYGYNSGYATGLGGTYFF
jgi:Spy/CpxP family protein refolding chaperone